MATVTTLASAPATGMSEANGINDDGAVAGQADTQDAFLWVPQFPNATTGTVTPLPTLFGPGASARATAMSVNNSGVVVGYSDWVDSSGNPVERAVVWNGGNVFPLPTLNPDPANPGAFIGNSRAVDINDNGDIVGKSDSPGGEVGFLIDGSTGQIRNLFSLVPASSPVPDRSRATSINNNGDIVGVSDALDANGTVVERAFLLPAGAQFMIDLGTLVPDPNNPGLFSETSAAYGINDSGRIIGSSDDGNDDRAATEFFNGFPATALLPASSEGFDVGPTGEVVGSSGAGGFVLNGAVVDLNTLVTIAGMTVDYANSINAASQIAASATVGGVSVGILITP